MSSAKVIYGLSNVSLFLSFSLSFTTTQEYLKSLHHHYEKWLGNKDNHRWHGNTPVLVSVSAHAETYLCLVTVMGVDIGPIRTTTGTFSLIMPESEAQCKLKHRNWLGPGQKQLDNIGYLLTYTSKNRGKGFR